MLTLGAQLAGRSGSKMLKAAAIAGGALASTSLAASATAAALTSERGRDEDQAKSLHRFLFPTPLVRQQQSRRLQTSSHAESA